jgi:hypothetical protein
MDKKHQDELDRLSIMIQMGTVGFSAGTTSWEAYMRSQEERLAQVSKELDELIKSSRRTIRRINRKLKKGVK